MLASATQALVSSSIAAAITTSTPDEIQSVQSCLTKRCLAHFLLADRSLSNGALASFGGLGAERLENAALWKACRVFIHADSQDSVCWIKSYLSSLYCNSSRYNPKLRHELLVAQSDQIRPSGNFREELGSFLDDVIAYSSESEARNRNVRIVLSGIESMLYCRILKCFFYGKISEEKARRTLNQISQSIVIRTQWENRAASLEDLKREMGLQLLIFLRKNVFSTLRPEPLSWTNVLRKWVKNGAQQIQDHLNCLSDLSKYELDESADIKRISTQIANVALAYSSSILYIIHILPVWIFSPIFAVCIFSTVAQALMSLLADRGRVFSLTQFA